MTSFTYGAYVVSIPSQSHTVHTVDCTALWNGSLANGKKSGHTFGFSCWKLEQLIHSENYLLTLVRLKVGGVGG